jgi:hypothetical protein
MTGIVSVAPHAPRAKEASGVGRDTTIPPAYRAWLSVIILLLVGILSYLDRLVISLMVGPIRASLHVTDFQIGLLQGVAFGLFYALFGLPIGWLVDRYSDA